MKHKKWFKEVCLIHSWNSSDFNSGFIEWAYETCPLIFIDKDNKNLLELMYSAFQYGRHFP